MPGRIQSLERGAALLSLLGAADELSLAELADSLDLPRPTVHGLLATLVHVGFVHQDAATRRYSLGSAVTTLGAAALDPHDLRSHATSWCDSLAARTRAEVLVGMSDGDAVAVVHHVFRPDGSTQRLRIGERLPLHATGLGKALLAAVPGAHRAGLGLERFTSRTISSATALAAVLDDVRRRGWATGVGEHRADAGDVAAPIRGSGGLVVGSVACAGPVDRLFAADGRPRVDVAAAVSATALAIGRAVVAPR